MRRPQRRCSRRQRFLPNYAQRVAARSLSGGPVAVIAGAGTGKTLAIVHAVVYLVTGVGVVPGAILLLTFTRRAAKEMIDRACRQLRGNATRPQGGTFHSLAARILRQYSSLAGISKNFLVLDREDSIAIIRNAIKELKLEKDVLPRPGQITDLISASRNKEKPLKEIVMVQAPEYLESLEELEQIRDFYFRYKAERNELDFDDLLEKLVDLLAGHLRVREKLQKKYRWILVDEGQDLNGLQVKIIDLLAEGGKVMIVGDDAQAIYGWRGAEPENLRTFVEEYNAKIVTLEQNYRSRQPILDVANHLLETMPDVFRKNLFTRRKGGEQPVLLMTREETEEAVLVADEIEHRLGRGVRPKDIGVLYRKNRDPMWLEMELDQRQIPYIKYGGIRFKECAHVKDVIAHLRVLVNQTDELSWLRLLNLLERVGPATANKIYDKILFGGSVAEILANFRSSGKARAGLRQLADLYTQLERRGTPEELTRFVVSYYLKIRSIQLPPSKVRDLEQLIKIASSYNALAAMLTDFTLEAPDRRGGGDDAEEEKRIVLSTVHSAKGLEWKHVFVIKVEPGSFPCNNAEDVEEERRLLYVAITRARERLWVSARFLSPFLLDLPLFRLFEVRASKNGLLLHHRTDLGLDRLTNKGLNI